jgi:hypothetical protein
MVKLTIDAMAERLERLERENRRLKRIGGLVLLGAVASLLSGADDGKTKPVEAERFVLKDRAGLKRAELSAEPNGSASFNLFDRAGKVRLRMAIEAAQEGFPSDEALVSVCDERGKDRVVTLVNPFGVPQLSLFDRSGKDRLNLLIDDANNFVSFQMSDRKDARRFSLDCGEDGSVGMHFEDVGPKARLSLYANDDGKAGIAVADGQEKDRFVVEGDRNGLTTLRFLDEKGRAQFKAP